MIPGRGRAAVLPGRPYPLGATWDGTGVNFALFSAHAEHVELCIFDPRGRREIAPHHAARIHRRVWHGYLPDARPGALYGYRVYGPYDPANGHRFNHHKLLLDPYATKIARHAALERRALRLPHRLAARRPLLRPPRQRRRHAEMRRRRYRVHVGRRPALHTRWHDLIVYETARPRLHDAAPRRPAGDSRHVRGPLLARA